MKIAGFARLASHGAYALQARAGILALGLLFGSLAIFLGLLATTESPVLIGLAAGLFGGLFLLAVPKIAIELILVFGLASGALLLMAGPGFGKVSWAISMIAFLLWGPSAMALAKKPRLPAFVWFAVLLVVLSVCSMIFERQSPGEFLQGFKRYFQMYGLMFAMALLPITAGDIHKWMRWLLMISLLQLPFAAYERFFLVPLRGNSAQAMDVVAGTLGANLTGGSPNSVMALFVILAFVFVFMRWRAGAFSGGKALVLGMLLLAPLGLGETKIVVLMIPLAGAVLLHREFFRNPLRYLPLVVGAVLLTLIIAYVYVFLILDSSFHDVVKETFRYNVGGQDYGNMYLNRTSVMTFWWSLQGLHDPVGFLFGHGLGSSYGFITNTGHIAARYPMHGIGFTTIAALLWDLGLVGLLLYISIFASAWLTANRLMKATADPLLRADLLSIQAGIALFVLFMPYTDSQINLVSMEIIVAFILGYLAYLDRQYGMPHVRTSFVR